MAEDDRSTFPLSRRKLLEYGAVLSGTALTSSLTGVQALATGRAKVNVQLGWLASNGILGEIVAKRMTWGRPGGSEPEFRTNKDHPAVAAWEADRS